MAGGTAVERDRDAETLDELPNERRYAGRGTWTFGATAPLPGLPRDRRVIGVPEIDHVTDVVPAALSCRRKERNLSVMSSVPSLPVG